MADIDSKSQSVLAQEFMTDFSQKKDELSSQIVKLSPEAGSSVNEMLTSLSNDIQHLSKRLHDAVIFLPAYSIKMRQNEIRDLEKALKEKEDLLIPKKKFGFKSKVAVPSNLSNLAPRSEDNQSQKQPEPKSTYKNTCGDNNGLLTDKVDNFFTIENIKSATARHGESELNGNDVLVKNCHESVIILEGGPSTLRLVNLEKCKLLCGPVRTSVFVENVCDSTLFLCCHQLRTHSSEKLDIYLRVGSRAIIEDCKGIRFGPYEWDHDKAEELHRKAEISSSLVKFDAVDDFNWLSSSPSPNWSVIPPEEYTTFR